MIGNSGQTNTISSSISQLTEIKVHAYGSVNEKVH